MKKTIILACAALVMSAAAVMGYKVYQSTQITDLMKANLEALTGSETVDGHDVVCNGEVCIVFGYKNRFLAAGCKKKEGFTCTVKKIALPDISLW